MVELRSFDRELTSFGRELRVLASNCGVLAVSWGFGRDLASSGAELRSFGRELTSFDRELRRFGRDLPSFARELRVLGRGKRTFLERTWKSFKKLSGGLPGVPPHRCRCSFQRRLSPPLPAKSKDFRAGGGA